MSEEDTERDPDELKQPPGVVPAGKTSKDSDRAVRPGFRNPANTRSKASKKKAKKKKRR